MAHGTSDRATKAQESKELEEHGEKRSSNVVDITSNYAIDIKF